MEGALQHANDKFTRRFDAVEARLKQPAAGCTTRQPRLARCVDRCQAG
jgi:hypothetical protein